MGQTPYSTVGGYGGNPALVQSPSGLAAGLSDAVDGFPTLSPLISPTGKLVPAVIDSTLMAPGSGMPEVNAILIELRVISALLAYQLGDRVPDLQVMRADEAWNTNIATGAL